MKKRRLPLGIQAYSKIREENLVYVDKTERVYQLAKESAGVIFLSRPRRFGKSLLCSTLSALFEGRRELFTGLAVDASDWEWKKHPVIHIDLNPANYLNGAVALESVINMYLDGVAKKTGVQLTDDTMSTRFAYLIREAYDKHNEKVVVIIDEYDKPLLDTINEKEIHETLKNELRGFYGVLKSSDEFLRFVLLTGVTKFSQVSIFSQLNNLKDISLNPDYCDLCGITQAEVETCFEPEIERVVAENGLDRREYIDKLRRFYNGYRFSKKDLTVYNPFGLLNHFDNHGDFETYWFATGTPTFLIKLMEAQKIDVLDIEKKEIAFSEFRRFDVENMDALAVLYQSGYLTISGYGGSGLYTLDYPNEEVRAAFAESLLHHFLNGGDDRSSKAVIARALMEGNIEEAMNALRTIFASIPYGIQLKDEKYYHTIVHLVFRMLGLFCLSEVQTAAGRIDSLVETRKYVYCFEFKLNGSAKEALEQIDGKEYLLPWGGSGKKLFKVGVSFDYEKRNIKEWRVLTG
ncbi:MAG: ATP-binding protein [Spirochaetaceae bacterium]|jgi:PAS domain-containing protein|nr:ATP-binding protein [Spirochaetaceae bacterium]